MGAITLLGVDPGLQRTGWGIVRAEGNTLSALAWGVIQGKAGINEAKLGLAPRIGRIVEGLTAVIQTHQPDVAAVEIVFVNVNPQSTLMLGQARGAALAVITQAHLRVMEITALQVKQGVVGYGRATKEQIRMMVHTLLAIPAHEKIPYDASDALACAVSAAYQYRVSQTRASLTRVSQTIERTINATAQETAPENAVLQAYRNSSRRSRKTTRWTNAELKRKD